MKRRFLDLCDIAGRVGDVPTAIHTDLLVGSNERSFWRRISASKHDAWLAVALGSHDLINRHVSRLQILSGDQRHEFLELGLVRGQPSMLLEEQLVGTPDRAQ